jgi:MbtH protein
VALTEEHTMAPRDDEEEDTRAYTAVVNPEEQYSIWLADKEIPAGWKSIGKTGPKKDCLALIGQIWTDMRPLSLRKWMEEQAAKEAAEKSPKGVQS